MARVEYDVNDELDSSGCIGAPYTCPRWWTPLVARAAYGTFNPQLARSVGTLVRVGVDALAEVR